MTKRHHSLFLSLSVARKILFQGKQQRTYKIHNVEAISRWKKMMTESGRSGRLRWEKWAFKRWCCCSSSSETVYIVVLGHLDFIFWQWNAATDQWPSRGRRFWQHRSPRIRGVRKAFLIALPKELFVFIFLPPPSHSKCFFTPHGDDGSHHQTIS